MTDLDRYSFHDTSIYNPHLLSKEELVGLFSARQTLLEQLLEDLARSQHGEPPQHHLLVAQRGMGKTMLLRRLQFAVEDDPILSKVWLPLTFPEEQYNVGKLSDFWLNCIDALGDALDRRGLKAEAEGLDSSLEGLVDLEEDRRSRETLALLIGTAEELDRRLVLLVDNIDLILERISDQAWLLRETLSEEPRILLIGASAKALEATYKYDKPLYDFLQIHELGGLSLEETTDLLRHYAELWSNEEVLRIVREEPERIRTLHNLTGGNPRTLALLYRILGRGLDGDVRADLESLLDQCTPLYKARLEALSPQQQRVAHALAVHWHPASAAGIAADAGLEVNKVSSQLTRLVKEGVVEAVPFDPATKTGFQLAERFFNIWYLMRATRRARRRLLWLVEFLKMFYGQEQLRSHALAHLAKEYAVPPQDRLRFAEYSLALSEAFQDPPIRQALETSGLYTLIEDRALRWRLPELVDLEGREAELRPRAEHKRRLEKIREEILASDSKTEDWSAEDFWNALARSVQQLEGKERVARRLVTADAEELEVLQRELEREESFVIDLVGSQSVADALREAFARGWMMATHDIDGARSVAVRLEEPELEAYSLARRLDTRPNRKALLEELEPWLEKTDSVAVASLWAKQTARFDPKSPKLGGVLDSLWAKADNIRSPLIILNIASAWASLNRGRKSAELVDRALKSQLRGVPRWWLVRIGLELNSLASELEGHSRVREAATARRAAVRTARLAPDIDPGDPESWGGLGYLLASQGRFSEAEEAARKSLELAPKDAVNWRRLGWVLGNQGRESEAEAALRKSLELAPEDAFGWGNLGWVLGNQGRESEAEEALRKSLELEPEDAHTWRNLRAALSNQGRDTEAKQALLKALDLEPRGGTPRQPEYSDFTLPMMLARAGEWTEAFERAEAFVSNRSQEFRKQEWSKILLFFREAVAGGKAREAADLLDRLGMADRWLPLRQALETVAVGRRDYLKRLAPEVRRPVEEILEQLGISDKFGSDSLD